MPPAESVARDWRERGCVFVREAMSACCAAPKARRSPIRAANLDSASGSPVQSDLLGDPAAGALATPPELRGAIDAATTAGWIEAVLSGQVETLYALTRQVDRLMAAFGRMATAVPAPPAPGVAGGQPVSS
jgi:hypothetical protein